ncbi:MAG: isocitrate lyase/PEP mutase family protein [Rhodospirillales bacterium]
MSFSAARTSLRSILSGSRCVHPAPVFDPMSVRMAEDLGFELGMLGGSIASYVILGDPDIALMTQTEFVEQCRRICRASDLPLCVDADHGYGNALNVARTIIELEAAGVSGLSIEDTLLPAPHASLGVPALIPLEEMTGKLRAAVGARRNPGLCIFGRSHAGLCSADELISRLKAFETCGVDGLFIVGLKSAADLDAVASEVSLPLVLGGAPADLKGDLEGMAERGVRICLRGHPTWKAAVEGIYRTLIHLRDDVDPNGVVPPSDILERYSRKAFYDEGKNDYLGYGKK